MVEDVGMNNGGFWERMRSNPLVLCGFAVQAVAMFWAYYRPVQMDPVAQATSITNPTALLFSIGLGLLCLCLGLAYRAVGRLVQTPWFLVLMAIGFVGASLAQSLYEPSSFGARSLDFVARLAAILLLMGWLAAFDRFDGDSIMQVVPALVAFALVLLALTTLMGPRLRLAVVAVCAFAGLAWLLFALGGTRAVGKLEVGPRGPIAVVALEEGGQGAALAAIDAGSGAGSTRSSGPRLQKGALVALLVAFLLSMMLGVLCAFPYANSQLPSNDPFFRYFLLMMGAALLLLSVLSILHPKSPLSNAAIAKLLGIPLAVGVATAAFVGLAQLPLGPILNGMGRVMLDLSLVVAFLLAGRHFACPVLQIYPLGQAAFMAGNSLGTFLGLGIPYVVAIPGDQILIASVVILILTIEAVFVFVALYRFSLRERNGAKGRGSSGADGAEGAAVASPSAQEVQEQLLANFAAAYRLSEKETEVLQLFARGWNRQRIAEAMYVSMGTVNRYFTRLYQKADVHTRQELLDKLEEFANSAQH